MKFAPLSLVNDGCLDCLLSLSQWPGFSFAKQSNALRASYIRLLVAVHRENLKTNDSAVCTLAGIERVPSRVHVVG